MDTKSYMQLLQKKFGMALRIGAYAGKFTPIAHECRRCGTDFRASPERVLSGGLCLECTRASNKDMHPSVTAGHQFADKLLEKYEHIKCLEFNAVNREAKFTCWCGHEWMASPRQVLAAKGSPCSECSEKIQFNALGQASVLRRTGRLWEADNGRMSILRCWCGTRLEIASKFVGSLAVECPACLGIGSEEGTQVTYKFKGLEYVSYHVGGTILVPNAETGWAETRAKAKQVARLHKPVLKIHIDGKYVAMPDGSHVWNLSDVWAWRRQVGLERVTVLSLDPGVTNCAWAVLDSGRSGAVKLLATGMIQNTVREFTGDAVRESSARFTNEIQQLVEEYSVTHLIAERFMSRGMKGLTIELVNAMLGILINGWKGRRGTLKLVTAAQWKNEWNRNSDLTAFYAECDCEVHQVDAIGIGLYGIDHWFNRKPFEHIRRLEVSLIKQIRLRNFG